MPKATDHNDNGDEPCLPLLLVTHEQGEGYSPFALFTPKTSPVESPVGLLECNSVEAPCFFQLPPQLPPPTPFRALPGLPAETAFFPALPLDPDMRLVVPEISSAVSVMEDYGDGLRDNLTPGDVYRIVGQLPADHALRKQILHVHQCVAECATMLNKVVQFDEDNQRVVNTKLEYCGIFLQEIGKYCQQNFENAGKDLQHFRESVDSILRVELLQNLQQTSETLHEAETRNDSKFLHMQDGMSRLFANVESCSTTLLQLQQQLHAQSATHRMSEIGNLRLSILPHSPLLSKKPNNGFFILARKSNI